MIWIRNWICIHQILLIRIRIDQCRSILLRIAMKKEISFYWFKKKLVLSQGKILYQLRKRLFLIEEKNGEWQMVSKNNIYTKINFLALAIVCSVRNLFVGYCVKEWIESSRMCTSKDYVYNIISMPPYAKNFLTFGQSSIDRNR